MSQWRERSAEEEVELLQSRLEAATDELTDLRSTFDLRWKADMRAIAAWRKGHPDRELKMPGQTDLCLWLLERLDKAREALKELDEYVLKTIDYDGARAAYFANRGVPEDELIVRLCEEHGFGAVMDSAQRQWALRDPIGAHTISGCAGVVGPVIERARQVMEEIGG